VIAICCLTMSGGGNYNAHHGRTTICVSVIHHTYVGVNCQKYLFQVVACLDDNDDERTADCVAADDERCVSIRSHDDPSMYWCYLSRVNSNDESLFCRQASFYLSMFNTIPLPINPPLLFGPCIGRSIFLPVQPVWDPCRCNPIPRCLGSV